MLVQCWRKSKCSVPLQLLAKARLRGSRGSSTTRIWFCSQVSACTLLELSPHATFLLPLKASHTPTCRFWKNAKKLAL